ASDDGSLLVTGQIQPRQNPRGSWIGSWNAPGMRYGGMGRVRAEGGSVARDGNRLTVRGADVVTILFSGATSFRNFRDIEGDAAGRAAALLDAAWPKSLEALRQGHRADHQALFRRVTLELGADANAAMPTDARIAAAKTQDD